VRSLYLTLLEKKNLRLVFATLFLFVLLAEWGSHSMHYANASSADAADEQSISADQSGHEDPCQTLAVCSEGSRKDQQTQNLGHDSSQHNGLIDHFSQMRAKIDVRDNPLIPFENAHALFQPPNLQFHPPKLS
jgi:hypothetical protein